ncbi:hypothetical protein OAO87_04610 [bacterium]|nr:hypothetical protein [bacterium]
MLQVLRQHPGPPRRHPNSKAFEMASIVRWLFLAQLASDLRLDAVAFVDCDVHVLSDLAAVRASHPLLPLADLAITGYNGAISVWTRPAIGSFAAFLMTLVAACDPAILSKKWSVDMSIIRCWQRVQTDMRSRNGSRALPCVGMNATLPIRQIPFRTINLDALFLPSRAGGPVSPAWMFGAGNVGTVCQHPPKGLPGGNTTRRQRAAKGCPAAAAEPAIANCSDDEWRGNGFRAREAPLNHATKGPQIVKKLYKLPAPRAPADAGASGSLCTPFVMDGCGTFAPYHAPHFTGRFKEYMDLSERVGRNCTCLRSWTDALLASHADEAVLISHPTADS